MGDLHTPVSLYLKIRDAFPQSALLESSDYHANENCEGKVNEQEGKASAFTHFVGEAPDVPQTDGRADSRHDEAECASP